MHKQNRGISHTRTRTTRVRDNHTNTYVDNHLAALAGSDLCEQLQDEGLGHVPGQVPHIPANTGHRTAGFVKQEVAWKQRLAYPAS